MSPKWAKKAHFGDISYNVFNRRKSSYLILKPLNFTISWRMYHFNESNHQKLIAFLYLLIIYKNPSVRFWCYRVYLYLIRFTISIAEDVLKFLKTLRDEVQDNKL